MFCDYKISRIQDTGNKVDVIAYINEGEYQEVLNNITNQLEKHYIRLNKIGQIKLMFEKSPVNITEIEKELKKSLKDLKGNREIIAECQ
jgi:phage FluMu gp28-like protein